MNLFHSIHIPLLHPSVSNMKRERERVGDTQKWLNYYNHTAHSSCQYQQTPSSSWVPSYSHMHAHTVLILVRIHIIINKANSSLDLSNPQETFWLFRVFFFIKAAGFVQKNLFSLWGPSDILIVLPEILKHPLPTHLYFCFCINL